MADAGKKAKPTWDEIRTRSFARRNLPSGIKIASANVDADMSIVGPKSESASLPEKSLKAVVAPASAFFNRAKRASGAG